MKRVFGLCGIISCVALSGVACTKGARPAALTLAGSTSVQPFAEKWSEAFRAAHPDIEIHVQGGGSTAGIQSAVSGAAEVGMVSRELKSEEASKIAKQIVVARDGIAVVVNKENPVSDLPMASVQKIFAGEIQNWKEVGGSDAKINTITREDGSGTRGAFEELVMKSKKIVASALVQDSTGAVRQMISSDPAAIGYISLGQVDPSVKALKLEGVEASEAMIDAGKYPLVRPFLFVAKGELTGSAKQFLDFITGPEGQALTRKEGLLPPRQ